MDRLTAAALGPRQASGMFGFINLDEDRDGVVRHGRLRFRDRAGTSGRRGPPISSRRLDLAGREFWIDARIGWNRYARISWKDVPAALDRDPGLFRGRLVLLGGEFNGSGDDYHRIPFRAGTGEAVSGLTLQALMVDTISTGLPVREAGRIPVLVLVMLAAACGMAGILCASRTRPIAVWSAAAAGVYLGVSFPIFWWTGLMLPITAPLLVALVGIVAAFRVAPAPFFAPGGLETMSILRILSLAVLVAMPAAGASEPVAIVYSLSGEVALAAPHTGHRPLRLFDRLPSRAVVKVGRGSRLALAFTSGLRYEMESVHR